MFGNDIDIHGHIDSTFNSPITGGVRSCDNRSWCNFCRTVVERYRGAG